MRWAGQVRMASTVRVAVRVSAATTAPPTSGAVRPLVSRTSDGISEK
jgi:hypothetical protein